MPSSSHHTQLGLKYQIHWWKHQRCLVFADWVLFVLWGMTWVAVGSWLSWDPHLPSLAAEEPLDAAAASRTHYWLSKVIIGQLIILFSGLKRNTHFIIEIFRFWISKHALQSIHGNPRLPVVALLMFEQEEGVGWPRYAVKKIFGRAEANLKQTDEDRTEERGFTGNIRFNQIAQYSHHRYLGWPPPIFTAIQPCAPSQSPLDKLGGFRSS